MGIIEKIFGTHSHNELKRIYPIVDRIEALAPAMEALSDENDEFFDGLYAGLNINRVSANRAINSKGKGRGKINELLIKNY